MIDRAYYGRQAAYATMLVLVLLFILQTGQTQVATPTLFVVVGVGAFGVMALTFAPAQRLEFTKIVVAALGFAAFGWALFLYQHPEIFPSPYPLKLIDQMRMFLGLSLVALLLPAAYKGNEVFTAAKVPPHKLGIFYFAQPVAVALALLTHMAEAKIWLPLGFLAAGAVFQIAFSTHVDRCNCGPAEVVAGPGVRTTAS